MLMYIVLKRTIYIYIDTHTYICIQTCTRFLVRHVTVTPDSVVIIFKVLDLKLHCTKGVVFRTKYLPLRVQSAMVFDSACLDGRCGVFIQSNMMVLYRVQIGVLIFSSL